MKSGRSLNSAGSSDDAMKRARLCRFLRLFFFFIVFMVFTMMIYMQASDSHFLDNASHFFNITETSHFLAEVPIHFPEFSEFLHLQEQMSSKSGGESNSLMSEPDKTWSQAYQLLERSEGALNWIATPPVEGSKSLIKWDTVAYNEVHILHKLTASLKRMLRNPTAESKIRFLEYVQKGHQCTPVQAAQQEAVSKLISMDICSEVEWYKVVQLAWPEARHFLDVGANKGYLGSLFVALWGGNGLELAPADILNAATRLQSWKDSRNPAGYCKDGFSRGIPLTCTAANRDKRTGKCNVANTDLRVTSIDGSSYLAETLNHIIRHESPIRRQNEALRDGTIWKYLNYAVSDVNGVARFTKQSKEKNAGFEGGSIRGSSAGADPATSAPARSLRTASSAPIPLTSAVDPCSNQHSHLLPQLAAGLRVARRLAEVETEEVNMTTIDSFLQRSGMTQADILKIDTEGNDNRVLDGASSTIINKLGMFTFEGGKGVTFSKEMIEKYDALGFSCYSTSRAGLFKWNSGCMKEQYMGGFRAKDKGNIFCVSRKRAPMATLAYDILSFPMMIEDYLHSSEVVAKSVVGGEEENNNAKLFRDLVVDEAKISQVEPSMFVPIYLNIKPFCTPFPECARL